MAKEQADMRLDVNQLRSGLAVADAQLVGGVDTRPRSQAIRVASGELFWPLQPRENEIEIEDIAHGLSQICRFTGHTRSFYSVAQHSVLVSRLCPPAIALHLWRPGTGLITHVSYIGTYDGPRPFRSTQ